MFLAITNTPRDFAWGGAGEISELLGVAASGRPEAELWLGAHPVSPSRIVDPAQAGGAVDLAAWIAADPTTALGLGAEARLPFLLKVLSAGSALSLQAHPTAEQAQSGFARENKAGIPVDAPDRNYRDAFPKPEIIYALSETFEALCGFRPTAETRACVERLNELVFGSAAREGTGPLLEWLDRLEGGDAALGDTFEWLISGQDPVPQLVATVVACARSNAVEFPVVVELADAYPGDPGIVISLMLHHVTLKRGEALSLPAGNIHAYLKGLGIELMTASDNVLRGGLTSKHIDVPELLTVVDFAPVAAPYLTPECRDAGVEVFHPEAADFLLARVAGGAKFAPNAAAIVMCTEGELTLSGARSARVITRGECLYVTPDEGELAFRGSGTAFLATTA